MREVTIFGLDVAKNVFQVAALGQRHQVIKSYRLKRSKLLAWFARQPKVLVALEACSGSHYWARELMELGFQVKIIPAQATASHRPGHQKNDARDAVGIALAGLDDQVRPVTVKSEDQLQIQGLFRVRQRLQKQQNAIGSQMRGLLLEFGVALPKSDKALRAGVRAAIEDERLPALFRHRVLREGLEEHETLGARVKEIDREVKRLVKADARASTLVAMKGIGPLTAAYIACVRADATAYPSGRQFSAAAGIVPRQSSTGDKRRLGSMTLGGDATLRTLLMHCARSLLSNPKIEGPVAEWGRSVAARRGFNVAVGAVANKLARHAWAEMNRFEMAR